MLLEALLRTPVRDPHRSVFLGDSDTDMAAAVAAGVNCRVLIGPRWSGKKAAECNATAIFPCLWSAVQAILLLDSLADLGKTHGETAAELEVEQPAVLASVA